MFKKKIKEENPFKPEEVNEFGAEIYIPKELMDNKTNTTLCAGCGKVVNVPTAQNEKGVYHSTECFNKVNPAQ